MRGLVPGVSTPHSLLGVLPGIYSEDDLTCRLVGAFDDGLVPVFVVLDNAGAYLDPALTPPDFLQWLGKWVAAVDDPELSVQRRRALVARAVELHARRGTAAGLVALVELAIGAAPEIVESGGTSWSAEPRSEPPGDATPGIVVRVRADGAEQRVVEAVVAASRPAHVPHRVEVVPADRGGQS